MNSSNNYIFLTASSDQLILNLIRSRLEEAGYDFRIHGEKVSVVYPIPNMEARIFVHDDHYAEAKLLVEKIMTSLDTPVQDQDFRDSDIGDIMYEKEIMENQKMINSSRVKNVIYIVILILIAFILIISAL